MKTQKLKQNAVSFLVELIFNKWSLLFILYATSALVISYYGVATARGKCGTLLVFPDTVNSPG